MNFLLLILALAPLLVKAQPWNSSCKGLSEGAFIVIVVESVVILLLLVLGLFKFVWARRRRQSNAHIPLSMTRRDIDEYVDRVPTPRAKTSRDSVEDSGEDSELSAPFLPRPSAVPETLRPRSRTLSTWTDIGSPSLYVTAPPPLTSRQSTYTSRLSLVAHPQELRSTAALPNPHSEDHDWLPEDSPTPSPTVEATTTTPSLYSQPSFQPHLKPASIAPLRVDKRPSESEPPQLSPTGLSESPTDTATIAFPNPHSEDHTWADDDPLPSPVAHTPTTPPNPPTSTAPSWASNELRVAGFAQMPTPTDLSHNTSASSFADPTTPSARSLHIAPQPLHIEIQLLEHTHVPVVPESSL